MTSRNETPSNWATCKISGKSEHSQNLGQIWPKIPFFAQILKNDFRKWNLHPRIELHAKFQENLSILKIWTKFAQIVTSQWAWSENSYLDREGFTLRDYPKDATCQISSLIDPLFKRYKHLRYFQSKTESATRLNWLLCQDIRRRRRRRRRRRKKTRPILKAFLLIAETQKRL